MKKTIIYKRLVFRCWQCKETYSLYKEADLEQKLKVACPYCDAEAVVDFRPYHKRKITVLKSSSQDEQVLGGEYQLPKILPTSKPE